MEQISLTMLIHIITGTVAIVAGVIAIAVTKGKSLHARAGTGFVYSMLIMALSGTLIAILQPMTITAIAGIYTIYLVMTAWQAVKSAPNTRGRFDYAFPVCSLLIIFACLYFSDQAGTSPAEMKHGISAYDYYFFVLLASLSFIGDVRLAYSGGLASTPRLIRHLWRMCFALFIAVGSFLSQGAVKVVPQALIDSGLLAIPEPFILLVIVYWCLKLSLGNKIRQWRANRTAQSSS
ncbi:hypothetical protein CWB99_16785 [Pseudoalteromonas rubra]|uniref:DUF2306 domain-containing protein n=1 Tax=Pseudoalteromonas rubra TaxID=43658 RepID=A0A5S3WIB0_9GAMM|nr:DUF2306 domain-containing protein [Pseudoalteromonas rubra]TMP26957.1 hypothetical protein CWB99_16785 [Pseudoalteromonas rubra]TMP27675.1 hypothetical protein CWC00_22980 [Pseudoalteromonas rubra]